MAPRTEMRKARRLPYLKANGCQKSRPHPRNKNMYPVPALRVLTDIPVSSDIGTSTEYTVETATPVNQVYLPLASVVLQKMDVFTCRLEHIMDNSFLRGLQFNGSLMSPEGVGSNTISPLAWRVCIEWSKSTRWIVPGMASPEVLSEVNAMVAEIRGRRFDSKGK